MSAYRKDHFRQILQLFYFLHNHIENYLSSEEIYNKVKTLNIDYAQGYYFGKPINFQEV